MKYQVGDVLLNTHNGGTRVVTKVNNNDTVWFEGSYGSFSTEGFVLKERKIMNKFKVGDKVRMVNPGIAASHGANAGEFPDVGLVSELSLYETGNLETCYVRIEDNLYYWPEDALELVEEKEEVQVQEESLFKVGQTVYCLLFGKGEVTEVQDENYSDYPVTVSYKDADGYISQQSYTAKGKYYCNANRILYFSEPKIDNGVVQLPAVPVSTTPTKSPIPVQKKADKTTMLFNTREEARTFCRGRGLPQTLIYRQGSMWSVPVTL